MSDQLPAKAISNYQRVIPDYHISSPLMGALKCEYSKDNGRQNEMIEHHTDNVLISLNHDKPDIYDKNIKNSEISGD